MKYLWKYFAQMVAVVLATGILSPGNLWAGIRLDGTEFQSGSQQTARPTTAPQDAQATIPGTQLVYTLGQAVLAKGEIKNSLTGEAVKIGLGYDFNAQNTTGWGCSCPNQGVLGEDDKAIDATALNAAIQALFFGGENPQDPLCPTVRLDLNCDGFIDASDLNYLIELIFYGGAVPCLPCAD